MTPTDAQRELYRREYVARVNRVIDYIERHLDGDLRLITLANVAGFSQFHFHRVFSAMVGETVHEFVRRVRVETAAAKLLMHQQLPITEVALACGYASSASFSREFRRHFGMSPSNFRSGGFHSWKSELRQRKIGQDDRKIGEDTGNAAAYPDEGTTSVDRRSDMKSSFEIKEMPEKHVAYVRHTGSYSKVGEAFERLGAWAGPRGLMNIAETQFLAVYHDSPEITEESKLRSDACITVPPGTEVDGEVILRDVPGGVFAVGHFEIDVTEYGAAWNKLMGEFLPESGNEPDDRLCYELYLNDPDSHPQKKHIVDICEPVRPMK